MSPKKGDSGVAAAPCGLPDDLIEVIPKEDGSYVYQKTLKDGSVIVFDYERPFILELELTWRCNLKCFHCYVEATESKHCEELTLAEVKTIIDDAVELGTTELSLTGGEVLLREDLPEILAYGHQSSMGLRFVTNGSLLDESWMERLAPYPIKLVTVSLDAFDREIHNEIRGVDCYGATMDGINRLIDNGYRVSIITAFCRDNLPDFDNVLNFCIEKGLDWQVQMTSVKGRCPKERVLDEEEYYELGTKVAQAIVDKPPINIIPMDDLATFSRFHPLDVLSQTWQCGCSGGRLNLFVRADGSVTPCSAISFEPFVVGNVRETRLRDLCRQRKCAETLKTWLSVDELQGQCARCPNKERCLAGCPEILCTMCASRHENRYCYWAIEEKQMRRDLDGIW